MGSHYRGGGGLVCMVYPTIPYYLLHLSMAILVSSCAIQKRHTLSGLLNSRLMIYLGGISYGLYMLHMLCKNVITKLLVLCGIQGFELLVFPLTAILAIIAATLSFRFFESPFLRIKLTFQR